MQEQNLLSKFDRDSATIRQLAVFLLGNWHRKESEIIKSGTRAAAPRNAPRIASWK